MPPGPPPPNADAVLLWELVWVGLYASIAPTPPTQEPAVAQRPVPAISCIHDLPTHCRTAHAQRPGLKVVQTAAYRAARCLQRTLRISTYSVRHGVPSG